MTAGAPYLEGLLKDIVGPGRVFTTPIPIILYPLIRWGGIRCMILFAPSKIVGLPVREYLTDLAFSSRKT